ncbi:hypothetical protein SCHPADRAFT_131632 [Schizopora paradoxa]|uniref:Uncharacterized protein n=1 Tax=Schizopora paradoxa TaxID=27342 RepID=A0A0H2S293_9AGAM|nr:hypothetical protein SCHPADRAFT_131632 [Schizopora paradoxa]
MNIENWVINVSPDMLSRFAQSNLRSTTLHSPTKQTVTFIDPRGQEMEVMLACCISYQTFVTFLRSMLYKVETEFPIRGARYVESRNFTLMFGREGLLENNTKNWLEMLDARGPLEMFLHLEQPMKKRISERCPRCNAPLPKRNIELNCWSCKLDYRTNNGHRLLVRFNSLFIN